MLVLLLLCPPLIGGGIKQCFCLTPVWRLTSVCLSVAYIGPKSRTEMPRKTKIGKDVTCDLDTTFKVKRSKVKVTRPLYSPPYCRVRQLQRWAWERVGREKLLLRCRLLGRARRFGVHGKAYVAHACLQIVAIGDQLHELCSFAGSLPFI